MTTVFNSIDETHLPFSNLLSANISVIPKPGKDPSQCSSYRPISLLNLNIKIYAKVLENRLSPLLPSIIHKDQVGFIPGQEARDNTTKTIHLISYIQRHKLKACLLSFDAEKAFDRVNWQFLRLSLQQIGLDPTFISKVMALYSCPSGNCPGKWLLLRTLSDLQWHSPGLPPIAPAFCHSDGTFSPSL